MSKTDDNLNKILGIDEEDIDIIPQLPVFRKSPNNEVQASEIDQEVEVIEKPIEMLPVPRVQTTQLEKIEGQQSEISGDVKEDYDKSRDAFDELIETGKDALVSMLKIANESEHPKAFETLAILIKNVSEATEKLMDLQLKMKELKTPVKGSGRMLDNGTTNIDKAVFIGSTSDLINQLKNKDKEKTE